MPTFRITDAMDNDRALLINEYREGFMRTFAGQTVLMESQDCCLHNTIHNMPFYVFYVRDAT